MDEVSRLQIKVEGATDLIGFGSGNPKSIYNYTGVITETFNGRALAILNKNGQTGNVTVTVSSDKYKEEIISFQISK